MERKPMIVVVRNGDGLDAEIRNVLIVMAKDTNEASEWALTWESANDPHWPYENGHINIFAGLKFDENIEEPTTVFDSRHDTWGQDVHHQFANFLNLPKPTEVHNIKE